MDDDFEIDLYGEEATETQQAQTQEIPDVEKPEALPPRSVDGDHDAVTANGHGTNVGHEGAQENDTRGTAETTTAAPEPETNGATIQQAASTKVDEASDAARTSAVPTPLEAPVETQLPERGVKRKDADERPVDPGASTAIIISDLQWWQTDDDIRGWARYCDCEDELTELTFSEHKVNGKSKG